MNERGGVVTRVVIVLSRSQKREVAKRRVRIWSAGRDRQAKQPKPRSESQKSGPLTWSNNNNSATKANQRVKTAPKANGTVLDTTQWYVYVHRE